MSNYVLCNQWQSGHWIGKDIYVENLSFQEIHLEWWLYGAYIFLSNYKSETTEIKLLKDNFICFVSTN